MRNHPSCQAAGKGERWSGSSRRLEAALKAKVVIKHVEPVPEAWTPRSTMSVIHGRPVRSLATNREPAVGG